METPGDTTAPPAPPALKDLWQVPALGLALALLAGGLVAAFLTAPKPDYASPLHKAEALLEDQAPEEALALLNQKLLPHLEDPGFGSRRARFHLLRARALYLGQAALEVSDPRNNRNILAEYEAAEKHRAPLDPQDLFQIADTLVSEGLYNEAIERAHEMPEEARERRVEILRRVVRRELAGGPIDPDSALRLVGEFASEPGLSVDEQAWVEARQAELLLARGYTEDVIRRILRTMPRLEEASPAARGELRLLLGSAYLDAALSSGEAATLDLAESHLSGAAELIDAGDPLRATVLHLLGRVAEQAGDLSRARMRYAQVVQDYAEEPVAWSALLGLAAVDGTAEASEGAVEDSLSAYARLVEYVRSAGDHARPTGPAVVASLMARFGERMGTGDLRTAVRFAELARDTTGLEGADASVIKALADACRRLAERIVEESGVVQDGNIDLRRLDPATREEARTLFLAGAAYYRAHADRMIIDDTAAYADSLWLAADSFDLAGDRAEAERAFREYAVGFAEDPRRAEATFRLAQAMQARGDYAGAANFYRSLIDGLGPSTPGGPFGDRSHVPLAQCLLSDEDPENDAEARALLERVVHGALGGPTSPGFHDALLELGRLHYRLGEYPAAIERLTAAEALSAADDGRASVRFLLADSYRLSAEQIERDLAEGRPEHEKRALRELRAERLALAATLYAQVRDDLERVGEEVLGPAERLYLRNSYLYLGDCAFDLEDYDTAILRYDTARDRYPRDPASLVALIQIVNAYLAQGDTVRARTANERAKRFFESLPPRVWDDPDLPMTNREWEAWLESSAQLANLAAAGGTGEEGSDGP